MTEQQERAAFEAWLQKCHPGAVGAELIGKEENSPDTYVFSGVNKQWAAWQARAAQAATPAPAPAGWKLVPVEPTPEMLRAAAAEWLKHGEHGAKFPLAQGFESLGICPSQRIEYSRATHVYRAMLAAAYAMTEGGNG